MTDNVDEIFFKAFKNQTYVKRLMPSGQFSIDGTLLEACVSMKSFTPKDGFDDEDGQNYHY